MSVLTKLLLDWLIGIMAVGLLVLVQEVRKREEKGHSSLCYLFRTIFTILA